MAITAALAGNPNSGKTTLFNGLTGLHQRVGNWPRVTVERKSGTLTAARDIAVVDLPGMYSLAAHSLEETISRDFLLDSPPDVVINVVDATNLERNLFLTLQLLELGGPVVVALNMMDVVAKAGDQIDLDALSAALGCPVVGISALKGDGIAELIDQARAVASQGTGAGSGAGSGAGTGAGGLGGFSPEIERAVAKLEALVGPAVEPRLRRFSALALLERESPLAARLPELAGPGRPATQVVDQLAAALGDEPASALAEQRYARLAQLVDQIRQPAPARTDWSDRIDAVVTNRWLALPVFAVVIFAVYFVAVTTVGTWATDWANDGVFGDGWSFFGLAVPSLPRLIGGLLEELAVAPWLSGLILDGIVAGVGAVLGFVPQMMILFLLLAALEACGYISRVAFILDRAFRRFGLSGKSFIPMLISTGCGIPGVMSSRTVDSEPDRRMTIMTTTFMPCGAKLPIIALVAGAVFDGAWWVAPSAYFLG
ncbi:MAG: ferrous iron transport protein B, partial [Bifidobacteriaceae bacterium]|nr:ferrous iron transport protein B [Bifidobacteriaceae bacterium]